MRPSRLLPCSETYQQAADGLPGAPDDTQSRYIEARIGGVRLASIYLPNGNPVGSDKFAYKLAWLERLERHARDLLASEEPVVLGGDHNEIPGPEDVYDPADWINDALWQLDSRRAFRRILWAGYTDAFRALDQRPHQYSFWDYQGGRWQRNEGIRIDHLLLSPAAADRLAASGIDRGPRGRERASDHAPVWCLLDWAMSSDGVAEGEKGLARRDLREIDLTGATLVDTDLRGASLHECDCAAASFLDARLDGCDLSNNSLQLASEKKLSSISFPAISSGNFGFPKDRCARILVSEALNFLKTHPGSSLHEVEFCIYDDETLAHFRREFENQG